MTKSLKVLFVCLGVATAGALALTVSAQPSFEVAENPPPTIDNFNVSPSSVFPNLPVTFTVRATDVSGVATVQAYVMNAANQPVGVVTLYDDGSHYDGGAGDNVFGNQWNTGSNPNGTYRVEIEANDLLGFNQRVTNLPGNSFTIGGTGVIITSPTNGASIIVGDPSPVLPVQIIAADDTNVSQVRLFVGSTQVGSVNTSGAGVSVTINWESGYIRGQRTLSAEADGATQGVMTSSPVTVTINDCQIDEQPFSDYVCGRVCIATYGPYGHVCGFDPEQDSNYPCPYDAARGRDYTYAGFACWDNPGSDDGFCCYMSEEPPPPVLSIPSFITPLDGETITVPDYTVSVQVVSSDPSYLAVDFYLDSGLIGTQFTYSSNPDTNIYIYSLPYDLRGVSGSHAFRVRLYDRNNPSDYRENSVTATVSLATPTVTIVSPVPVQKVSGTVSVVIEASYANGNIDLIELYDTVAGYLGNVIPASPAQNVTEIINWDTTAYPNGDYFLYALAYSGSEYGMSSPPVQVAVSNPVAVNSPL